jgi:hypothetical protein
MFHGLAFGADAAASSLAALVGAAEALGRFRTAAAALPLQILFAAFEGESFGRLGSRRFLAEVANFTCLQSVAAADSPTGRALCAAPLRYDTTFTRLRTADIAYVVAADQLGLAGDTLFAHPAPAPAPASAGGGGGADGDARAAASAWVSAVLAAAAVQPARSVAACGGGGGGDAPPWLPVADLGPAPAPAGALPPTPLLSFGEFAERLCCIGSACAQAVMLPAPRHTTMSPDLAISSMTAARCLGEMSAVTALWP